MNYRDRTFCVSENCTCTRTLTPEIIAAADLWWADCEGDAPISVAYFCGGAPNEAIQE